MAAAGAPRMVLASTSGTIGVSKRRRSSTNRRRYPERSSRLAVLRVEDLPGALAFEHGARLGIDVVAVNPSLLLGPGDRRLSSTGDVRKFLKRQIPDHPDGGISFVDARDAAAATRGGTRARQGRRALPARRPELDHQGILRAARPRRQRRAAAPQAAAVVEHSGARAVVEGLYRWRGKEPPVDRISVEMAEHYWWIDSSKRSASSALRPAIRSSRWLTPSPTSARASTSCDPSPWLDEDAERIAHVILRSAH